MEKISNPPFAPSLIESMRSIGYTLETAIADLIDNSITAKANTVKIRFSPYVNPYVAILDNGEGMSPEVLVDAMRHGSKNPRETRKENDLGRFGLGLKSASFSQCSNLTVVSLNKEGQLSAYCWDLDTIIKDKDWSLLKLEQEEIQLLPHVDELVNQGAGTLIVWRNLDRLSSGENSLETALGEKMDQTREHLALVFHRYISGEMGLSRLNISINNLNVESKDPFMLSNPATVIMPDENITVEGQIIKIKPYILPHISKLSPEELKRAGGEVGLRSNQGFYIYRNKRLIIWGTWFRLVGRKELTKLARVRIDIPNSLDHLWTIDIKKSRAHPPEVVRNNLRRIVNRIAEGSKRVYRYRGRKIRSDNIIHSWERVRGREGIFYRINRGHPIIKTIFTKLDSNTLSLFQMVLDTLEATFPADALYADMASDHRINMNDEGINEKLKDLADHLLKAASNIQGGEKRLLSELHMLDPFCLYPDLTNEIVRGYLNDDRECI